MTNFDKTYDEVFDEIFGLDFAYLHKLSEIELVEEINKEAGWPELIQEVLSLLYDKSPTLANEQAVKVVSESLGDVYCQSYALSLLFNYEMSLGIELIKEKVNTFDLYVFKEALEEIYCHRLYAEEFPELLSAVKAVNDRVRKLTEEERQQLGEELVLFESVFS